MYSCLAIKDNVTNQNETQKSHLSNLLNLHCLDSDNIQTTSPKSSAE